MRVVYPPSMRQKRRRRQVDASAGAAGSNLVHVRNAPAWADLDIDGATTHVGPFLQFLKTTHDDGMADGPAFTSRLLDALDESDASAEKAVELLRDSGSTISFTDLLALLGPAVQYALTLLVDKESRTSENVEKFVISLVLALAQTSNKTNEQIMPLDDELIQGITVTVRNIMHAFRKDFDKIDYQGEVKFGQKLFAVFGGRCLGACIGCCARK